MAFTMAVTHHGSHRMVSVVIYDVMSMIGMLSVKIVSS